MKTYPITGMTCAGCVATVTELLKSVHKDISVTLNPSVAKVPESVTYADLKEALKATSNYQILPAIAEQEETSWQAEEKTWLQTFMPMLVIMGLISLVSFKEAYDFHGWMMSFMAGFFIVFGGFKLFDLKGFVDAYQTYDIIAKRFRAYAYAYPFIEIGLGFAFLFHYQMRNAVYLSIILSTIGLIGVIKAIRSKQKIRCACLGTSLNLPMSSVTFVENAGMLAMGLMML